jgi:hypothetical protein
MQQYFTERIAALTDVALLRKHGLRQCVSRQSEAVTSDSYKTDAAASWSMLIAVVDI